MKDLVYITIIDFEMHRATCWKWKRNDVTNHLFLRTSFFPLLSRQCIQKTMMPYFLRYLKTVDKTEEKVVSVGKMFYS